jgi:hypothetical protein
MRNFYFLFFFLLIAFQILYMFLLENPIALSHTSELHTLLIKPSHTHALHELSNLFKISIYREICAY